MMSYIYGLFITLVFLMCLPVPSFAAEPTELTPQAAMKELSVLFPKAETKGNFCTVTLLHLEGPNNGIELRIRQKNGHSVAVSVTEPNNLVFKQLESDNNHRTLRYLVMRNDLRLDTMNS